MIRFILWLILFYLIYSLFKKMFLTPGNEKKKAKIKKKRKSSLNIDDSDIEDAKFKEIKK